MGESVNIFTKDDLEHNFEEVRESIPTGNFDRVELLESLVGCAGYCKNAEGLLAKLDYCYFHATPDRVRRMPLELVEVLLPAMVPAGSVLKAALELALKRARS